MASSVLIYVGSVAIFVWGVGHLMATRPVVAGFEPLSVDNRRIITMEWILEGATLCFVGALAGLVEWRGGPSDRAGSLVVWACAAMLLVMALVSARTGARTSVGPMKACPFVKTAVATLFVIAQILR